MYCDALPNPSSVWPPRDSTGGPAQHDQPQPPANHTQPTTTSKRLVCGLMGQMAGLIQKAIVSLAAAHNLSRQRVVCAFRAASLLTPQLKWGNAPSTQIIFIPYQTFNLLHPTVSSDHQHRGIYSSSSPPRIASRVNSQNNNEDEFEPTWTYVPYQPPPPMKRKPPPNASRKFSSSSEWSVPDHISIPEDQLTVSFSRASGAGGESTCV